MGTATTACSKNGDSGSSVPECSAVSGTAAVSFTLDDGKTVAPVEGTLAENTGTSSVVALVGSSTVLAAFGKDILRSTDAGCTWSSIGQIQSEGAELFAASGDRAYAVDSYWLHRIDGTTITKLTSPQDYQHGTGIDGLGVDPADPDHVRIADDDGQLWDSKDGGGSWAKTGAKAPYPLVPLFYDFAFDPSDIDHIVVGLAETGVLTTRDGGVTWKPATGFGGQKVNMFDVAIGPPGAQVVWGVGLVLDAPGGSQKRAIWRSSDDGATFSKVFEATSQIEITGGTFLAPHPSNPDMLYFFGDGFVHRYDHGTGQVDTWQGSASLVSTIGFTHVDPPVIYVGLAGYQVKS